MLFIYMFIYVVYLCCLFILTILFISILFLIYIFINRSLKYIFFFYTIIQKMTHQKFINFYILIVPFICCKANYSFLPFAYHTVLCFLPFLHLPFLVVQHLVKDIQCLMPHTLELPLYDKVIHLKPLHY